MKTDRQIEEIMMGMAYEKAVKIYSELLVERGTNPRNYGAINHPDGYAKITGDCGDTVEMFLRVKNGKIEESKFSTDGCMFSIAACSVATEMAKGKTVPGCIGITKVLSWTIWVKCLRIMSIAPCWRPWLCKRP